jgi:signal transduction histidine kinase
MRGIRGRLTIALVLLVGLTALVLGVGAYAFVDYRLHDRLQTDALAQTNFDLSVLAPERLGAQPTRADVEALLASIHRRQGVEVAADLGDGDPILSSAEASGLLDAVSPALREIVERGELGYQWASIGGRPVLITAGRVAGTGPALYYRVDASPVDDALGQLRLALVAGGLVLLVLALLAARLIARGILRPVKAAGDAAERIEAGDLSTRVPGGRGDEFGDWADAFNRMAATLESTIGRLQAAEEQNRRFVADVSHELRTPVAALVAEASLLDGQLDGLPPEARRPAEMMLGDVRRLRTLVDELMELSRFDASAERPAVEPVDVGRRVAAVVAARHPDAVVQVPSDPIVVETDPRRLDRIVGNLLDNARQHAPGTRVEVTVERAADAVVVSVADRGPGVTPEVLSRLFDRFYMADPARAGGSGLGLAIAAEHAAVVGADLRAVSPVTGGLRFELRLPAGSAVTEPLRDGDGLVTGGADA